MSTKAFTYAAKSVSIEITRNTGSLASNDGSPFTAVNTNTITATVEDVDPFTLANIQDSDLRVRADQLEAEIKAYLDADATVDAQLADAGYE